MAHGSSANLWSFVGGLIVGINLISALVNAVVYARLDRTENAIAAFANVAIISLLVGVMRWDRKFR